MKNSAAVLMLNLLSSSQIPFPPTPVSLKSKNPPDREHLSSFSPWELDSFYDSNQGHYSTSLCFPGLW